MIIPTRRRAFHPMIVCVSESERVRVTVEILLDQETIAGTVRGPDGHNIHFAGWIGLMTALERWRRHAPEPAREEPTRRSQ